MPTQDYIPFAPSLRLAPHGVKHEAVPDGHSIDFSLYLKPRALPGGMHRASLAQDRHAVHREDIALVEKFAREAGLEVVAVAPERRLIKLRGSAKAIRAAFRTELHEYHDGGTVFRGRSGMLHMPADMAEIVEAVLGIDNRKIAEPRLLRRPAAKAESASYLPNQVAGFYNIPTTATGAGVTIALIELGGGFLASDNQAAFAAMGLAVPEVIAVPVDGGANTPTPDDGADGEVALDIQVAGGVAPGAKIAVYFTGNSDSGFVDAITAAATDATNKPSVMSISWGSPEANWTAQAQSAMTSALQDAAGLNVSVFVAAGDNLATDGLTDGKAHVDFPASSPWAIGCGGTLISVADGKISAEQVWNEGTSGTGGGISDVYPVPSFQEGVKLPPSVNGGRSGRGVPDVAGNADPNSGFVVVVSGQQEVVGGTSAVAPFWAGLLAVVNQNATTPAGFFLPKLYAGSGGAVREITKGNNKPSGSKIGYDAGPGWNACTGLGVPDGAAVIALLSQGAAVS
jgi:kumamolisin